MASNEGSKCPWARPQETPATSLHDVMSEQLASDLQDKEELRLLKSEFPDEFIPPELLAQQEDTSDDLLIGNLTYLIYPQN